MTARVRQWPQGWGDVNRFMRYQRGRTGQMEVVRSGQRWQTPRPLADLTPFTEMAEDAGEGGWQRRAWFGHVARILSTHCLT